MKSKMLSDSGETWRSVIRVPVKAALGFQVLVIERSFDGHGALNLLMKCAYRAC